MKKQELFNKYESEILGAINTALGGNWWDNLSEEAQEKIHDELYDVYMHVA